jgi:hypothetical protein
LSIYQLKPRFQALLRPLARFLTRAGALGPSASASRCYDGPLPEATPARRP